MMYNEMLKEDRQSELIRTEATQRNERMLGATTRVPSTGQAFNSQEGTGGDEVGRDEDDGSVSAAAVVASP